MNRGGKGECKEPIKNSNKGNEYEEKQNIRHEERKVMKVNHDQGWIRRRKGR